MALMLENCETSGVLLCLDSSTSTSPKPVPAPFLTKTYELVDDSATDHIVSWTHHDNSTFVVWRPPEFARDLLPKYFKHNNFSSFVRQLNTYGFRKIVPDRWEFGNEFFKKGEKHLLCEIHRRKTCSYSSSSHHLHQPHQLSLFNNFNPKNGSFLPFSGKMSSISQSDSDEQQVMNRYELTELSRVNSVSTLTADNERLRKSNSILMTELSHMKKLYNDIIYFVQTHVRSVAPPQPSPFLGFQHSHPKVQVLDHNINDKKVEGDNPRFNTITSTSSGSTTSTSSLTILEDQITNNDNQMKLFGVLLDHHHPKKARLVLSQDDLGLNLMPPSPS